MFEKIAKWYRMSLWTAKMVQNAVAKGVISEQDADCIQGLYEKEDIV